MKVAFWEQKIAKSSKVNLGEQLARESHQFQVQKISTIGTAMDIQVFRAEEVTTARWRQSQVRLNRAQQAATKWSDAEWHRAKVQLEHEIHHVTPVKRKLIVELLPHHGWQLLQEVMTQATSRRFTFTKTFGQLKNGVEKKVYQLANMTTDKYEEYFVCLSNAETKVTTWSIADMDCIVNQLERESNGITSYEQMQFKKELSIYLIEFEVWLQAISIQELWETIKQDAIHFRYWKMHIVSHILESFQQPGSGDNWTSDTSELLHISIVKGPYQSSNKVNSIWQRLKNNDWCTGLGYMQESLSYLALHG